MGGSSRKKLKELIFAFFILLNNSIYKMQNTSGIYKMQNTEV